MEVGARQLPGTPEGRAAAAVSGPVELRGHSEGKEGLSSEPLHLTAWYSGHVLFPSLLFLYTLLK